MTLRRPVPLIAVTARICTLYGDFSAISDAQFLVLGPGRLCTKLLLVLGSLLEMVLAGWRRAPESWDRRIG